MTRLKSVRRWPALAAIAALTALAMALLTMSAGTSAAADSNRGKSAVAQSDAPSAPMTGETEDGRDVTATFTPRKFHVVKKQLVVKGMLQGTIAGDADDKSRSFQRSVTMPVEGVTAGGASGGKLAGAAAAECDILNLVLGPLDLNLLGLEVHLDTVVLDITAVPGAGQLLGNLLCAVAGLLDGVGGGGLLQGLLTQLQGLLNQILGILNA